MAFPYYQTYPTYYPASYQPVVQPQQSSQNSMIWVSGLTEAQMYPVAPNNAVTLWSQTESVVYVKQADATGKPTLTVYDLVERKSEAPVQQTGSEPKYVTKEELGSVLAEIESMKSDLYGVAGKKKVKRNDADDE